MRRILLNEAEIGMRLAADVLNAQHMLLLKKGMALETQHLRMLKSWGVESLLVERPEADDGPAAREANRRDDITQDMAARFGETIEDPVMAEICRVATRIVTERTCRDS